MQLDPNQLLQLFEIKPSEGRKSDQGVWILGCVDQARITVLSQQHRALTLINALFDSGRATPDQVFGIVGGSIAGTMAACAAVDRGARVKLFELESRLLPVLASADHRWLHPGLFNWPLPKWDDKEAQVPFLPWEFRSASDVTTQIEKRFKKFRNDNLDRLEVQTSCKPFHVESFVPEVQTASGQILAFDHLIIAVGFGHEHSVPGSQSYWHDDHLSDRQTAGDSQDRTQVVVVGTGDGGLIDCLRARVDSFNENLVVGDFFHEWEPSERNNIEQKIMEFEGSLREQRDARTITIFYSQLRAPHADQWIRSRLRSDTKLQLIGRQSHPCTFRAAPLNRFLFSRLQEVDNQLVYMPGEFKNLDDGDGWVITARGATLRR